MESQIIKRPELKGLPGLNRLSAEERDKFLLSHNDKLEQYKNTRFYDLMANSLYNNILFINRFGRKAYDAYNDKDNSWESYDIRNKILEDTVVHDAFEKYKNDRKLNKTNDGSVYGIPLNDLDHISNDAKIKLMESKFNGPSYLNNIFKKEAKNAEDIKYLSANSSLISLGGLHQSIAINDLNDYYTGEAHKQNARENDSNILNTIYNDDLEKRTNTDEVKKLVDQEYSSPGIANMSDSQVKNAFKKAITPNSYVDANGIPNQGVSEYASHYGIGTNEGISQEMENFSIDDMRDVLAKKKVYESMMSPTMAARALNNEAKKYINQHQSGWKRASMYAKRFWN